MFNIFRIYEKPKSVQPKKDTGKKTVMRVFNEQGVAQTLGKLIAAGGQGSVYCVQNREDVVVKVYSENTIKKHGKEFEKKIKAAIEMKDIFKGTNICWPVLSVYNADGMFIGYCMKKGSGVTFSRMAHARLYKKYFPKLTRAHIVLALINICKSIKMLHKHDIIVGDLNSNNILVNPNTFEVSFIDCDSYQFTKDGKTWLCNVGRPEMTAPELQGQTLSKVIRSKESEYFSLSVLLFYGLMLGRSPYDYVGGENPIDNLKQGYFPYGLKANGERGGMLPVGPWFRIWSHLTYQLKSGLIENLGSGNRNVSARYTPDQWIKCLKGYEYCMEQKTHTEEIIPNERKSTEYRGKSLST